MLVNSFGNHSKRWINLRGARTHSQLGIIVENRGRQTIPIINDFKGILTNVTLDGRILVDWIQCGLATKLIDWLTRRAHEWRYFDRENRKSTGLFVGHFIANHLADTYFDPTGWGKGQFFINGHNIGRYWPKVGPQVTLYVPAPYLKHRNMIAVLELECAGNCKKRHCSINFTNHPIFNFTNNQSLLQERPLLWRY